MRRLLPVLLLSVVVLAACGLELPDGPGGTDAPSGTDAPETTDAPPTETTAPPTTEPPTATTVPSEGDGDGTAAEEGDVPVWVWIVGTVALIALGAVLFRPRREPEVLPPPAPAAATPVVDQGLKSDAYAEARWLSDRLTADLGDFKAQLDSGTVPPPADTDVRLQTLAALGGRTIAASNALYQAEASASTDAARGVIRAAIDSLDGLRAAFDGYVSAAALGDPGPARDQLETARRVTAAALEQLRTL